jgi:hypothetical protein
MRVSGIVTALLLFAVLSPAPAQALPSSASRNNSLTEPGAGTWRTWVRTSGSEFHPTAPPDQLATQAELQQLHTLESRRDAASLDQNAYWNTGDPAYRWEQLAVSKIGQMTPAGATVSPLGRAPDGQRAMALFSVAIYDATLAAWYAKYAYSRPHPSDIDATQQPALAYPSSPSYPSEHAVVAGAASSILAYLFRMKAAPSQDKPTRRNNRGSLPESRSSATSRPAMRSARPWRHA